MQHRTHLVGVQCDLLAAAPLQKIPKDPLATTIVYRAENEEDDLDTAGGDYCIMAAIGIALWYYGSLHTIMVSIKNLQKSCSFFM